MRVAPALTLVTLATLMLVQIHMPLSKPCSSSRYRRSHQPPNSR
jgi:hypothetical protein